MRKTSSFLMCCVIWAFQPTRGLGQDAESDVIHFYMRSFLLPFEFPVADPDVREIRLHVSRDKGATWSLVAVGKPDAKHFQVKTKDDGIYWYAAQVVGKKGEVNPGKLDVAACGLKINIDTVPPKVELKALPPRMGEIGIAWRITDDHVDSNSIKLEFRHKENGKWIRLHPNAASDKHYWAVPPMMPTEVRLTASDRAGNSATVVIRVPALRRS